MVMKYIKSKVIGDNKVKKVDKAIASDEQKSIIKKIISNFFFDEEPVAHRAISDMIEDPLGKCLIVAVSDSKKSCELNFYDLSSPEFRLIRRVTLQELFDELRKRV